MISRMPLRFRLALLGAISLGSLTLLGGCEAQKGPAEKAGERIDKTRENARDAIDPPGPVEKVGRDIDRAAGNSDK